MEYGKLEPASEEITQIMHAEGKRREEACFVRVPELSGVLDSDEVNDWMDFLLSVDYAGSWTVDAEDAIEEDGYGWIEDEHGGAMFVPYDNGDD